MTERGKKILIGVLVGVGSVIGLVVALVIGFGVWIVQPVELLDPFRLLGTNTSGYAEWRFRTEDPGTAGFVDSLIDALEDSERSADATFPPFVASWINANRNRDAMENVFPMVAAWTLSRGASPDQDLHLGTVSVARVGRRLGLVDSVGGLVFGADEGTVLHSYQGERIYEFGAGNPDNGVTVFIQNGTIFLTSDVEGARQAVDLLARDREIQGPTPLDMLFNRTSDTDTLRIAVSNANGEIRRLVESATRDQDGDFQTPGPAWDGLEGIYLSGGLLEDGAFRAEAGLIAPSANWDPSMADLAVAAIRDWLEPSNLDFEIQSRMVDDGILLDVRAPDLADGIVRTIRDNEQFRSRRARRIGIEIDN
jgi:hypothetical protein